ncbi:MAG TPA: hemolysin III family protein [Nocardioidaceae bacterium]|nr:hemolysin III family protein [Nocardioidaceae bacterium]
MTPSERISSVSHDVSGRIREAAHHVKPRMRGWLHAATLPLSIAAGIVLVVLSPTTEIKIASAIFGVSASLVFGISAAYHTRTWEPRARGLLKRLDHATIFLLIAGTYTPFTLLLLDSGSATILLSIIWAGALLGVAFRLLWVGAPRWLYVPVYVALGWAAAFWLGDFARAAGPAVLTLIIVGGGLYSVGGLVYGIKRPNPSPRWFGFHEVFHTLTIAAFTLHYVGVSLAAYSLR